MAGVGGDHTQPAWAWRCRLPHVRALHVIEHSGLFGQRGRQLLKVTTSSYSVVGGVPVAVLGLVFFAVMLVLQLPAMWRRPEPAVRLGRLAWAVVGLGTVLYLLYAELFSSMPSAWGALPCMCSRWCSSARPSSPRPPTPFRSQPTSEPGRYEGGLTVRAWISAAFLLATGTLSLGLCATPPDQSAGASQLVTSSKVAGRVGTLKVVNAFLPDPASPSVAAIYLTVENTGSQSTGSSQRPHRQHPTSCS